MKLSIKNKKIVIVCIVILIVAVICGIYFYSRNSYTTNDSLKDNAYIDIWRDTSMDMDIALYKL